MSPDQLAQAIISGINDGGEQFLEGTLAAALPVVWLALLGLHLGRPYILDMIDRFTLRLGADLLWLVYVALPLTGGLAAAVLFGVLLIKLMGDPDHDPRAFTVVTWLLGLGALLYFIPYIFGVQATNVLTDNFQAVSNFLVTSTNPNWAVALAYVSVAALAIMGAVAVGYTLRTGGRAETSDAEELAHSPQA